MANPLSEGIAMLQDFGFFDVFLPLLLIFFIFYAILMRVEILGKADKKFVRAINAIVAAIIAFLFITQTKLIGLLQEILPRSAMLLVITMLVLILLAFVGVYKTNTFESSNWRWAIAIPIILIFLGIMDASGFYIPGIHQVLLYFSGGEALSISTETLNIGIAVLVCATVVGLIAWIMAKGGD